MFTTSCVSCVSKKTKHCAFQYLLGQIKSKENEIEYGNYFKCQRYLLPNEILTWEEQVEIFSYRSRMNSLTYNFGGEDICLCGTFLNYEHLYSCKILNKEKHPRLEYSTKKI